MSARSDRVTVARMRALSLGLLFALCSPRPLLPWPTPTRSAGAGTSRSRRARVPGHQARAGPGASLGRAADRRRAPADHRARHRPPDRRQRQRQAPGAVPERQGVGVRRDRADEHGDRPGLRAQPPVLHLPGRVHGRWRPRRTVIAWRLNAAPPPGPRWSASCSRGCPTSSGRHGGCRLLIARNGALLVGTGDAAVGTNPQNLSSLGGKTLRLEPDDRRSRGRATRSSSGNGQAPLRAHLRTPQRPGPRPAPRRHALVGRARHLPRRRGQQAGGGRQLRLEPGARLQRVGADDRLRAARQAARRQVAVRRPDARDLRRDVRPR